MPEKHPLTELGEKEEPCGIPGEDACSVRGLPEVERACRTVHLLMWISKGGSSAPYPSGRSMTQGVICHEVEEELS